MIATSYLPHVPWYHAATCGDCHCEERSNPTLVKVAAFITKDGNNFYAAIAASDGCVPRHDDCDATMTPKDLPPV